MLLLLYLFVLLAFPSSISSFVPSLSLFQGILTRPSSSSSSSALLSSPACVIGIHKYSHDASIAVFELTPSKPPLPLLVHSKERQSRRKHDGGGISSLVSLLAKECPSLDLRSTIVVEGSHLQAISSIDGPSPSASSPSQSGSARFRSSLRVTSPPLDHASAPSRAFSSLPLPTFELSHHLSHLFSSAIASPHSSGICIVMDGMGSKLEEMHPNPASHRYISELAPCYGSRPPAVIFPPLNSFARRLTPSFSYREGESAYLFRKDPVNNTLSFLPLFKRFAPTGLPFPAADPEDSHNFGSFLSVGACYSLVSSAIFRDWNACGKVMGLAPFGAVSGEKSKSGDTKADVNRWMLRGTVQNDDLQINYDRIVEGPSIHYRIDDVVEEDDSVDDEEGSWGVRDEDAILSEAKLLAHDVQRDLESTTLNFVKWVVEQAQAVKDTFPVDVRKLSVAGGVFLNSVLNGKLLAAEDKSSTESQPRCLFDDVFVPPWVGDEGVAVGNAFFSIFDEKHGINSKIAPTIHFPGLPDPFTGPARLHSDDGNESDNDSNSALSSPYLEVIAKHDVSNPSGRLSFVEHVASLLSAGDNLVFLHHGRSEFGQRALGSRSILADPRNPEIASILNDVIKSREHFRPFGPSVLGLELWNWFEAPKAWAALSTPPPAVSPFMTTTLRAREERKSLIPAVVHCDGSSRVHTVDTPSLYSEIISRFFEITGVPMLLNTSFNTIPGEPIVETWQDAVRSFLHATLMRKEAEERGDEQACLGSDFLALGDSGLVLRRRRVDMKRLKEGHERIRGVGTFVSRMTERFGADGNGAEITAVEVKGEATGGRWLELFDRTALEILGLCGMDETTTIDEIMEAFKEDEETTREGVCQRVVRLFDLGLLAIESPSKL